jgi:biofilm PGA synthesis lipoprotein PgaB
VPDSFVVLCFHDVRDELRERPDPYTIEVRQLAREFAWLRSAGFQVVSLDRIIAARNAHEPLPARAVVLSFDDGLESVYTRAFPLLKAFNYPAIVGLVGAWLEEPAAGAAPVHYPDDKLTREDFLRPDQIREMQRSGLIEFASHSYAMHEGIVANPQGNLEPPAVSRAFDVAAGRYESDAAYAARLREDLDKSGAGIARLTGMRPRIIIWPYGAHNHTADGIASELGMPYGLTLELGVNTPDVAWSGLRRALIPHDVTIADLSRLLERPPRPEPMRVVQIDLDYVYDPDPAQQEKNLSRLLDRVKALGINTVFLQAYADPQGTGTAAALYFPNRRLPVRADLFNRVSWQLRTRTGAAVYAWLPLLAFDPPDDDPANGHRVTAMPAAQPAGRVRRLSPFDPDVRALIRDIYADLSAHAPLQGLLFSDDATLNDFEDATPSALAQYRQWDLPGDIAAIRADPALAARWAERKIGYLTDFSLELAALVRADHDDMRTARNLFAGVLEDPTSRQWFGQSYDNALASYDYVVLMAMPWLEDKGRRPDRWLEGLIARAAVRPTGLSKTVFELQAVDWAQRNRPVPGATLAAEMNLLRHGGALNFGYYPDDFRAGMPAVEAVRSALSLNSFPGSD